MSDWDLPETVKQDLQGTSWGRWRGTSSGRPGDQYLPAGKGLINIKNKDQKCFSWCHVKHINPSKQHPERIKKKTDKKKAEKPDYDEIEFPVQEKYFKKIEVKNNIWL